MIPVAFPSVFNEPAAALVMRDVVLATGPDTDSFLQGQLSQDVAAIGVGQSGWSLLLTPQGKVQAWLRVSRTGENALVLDVDQGAGEAMLSRLNRFKLRTKCDLALEQWHALGVRAPENVALEERLREVPEEVIVAAAEWPGVSGFDLLASALPSGLTETLGLSQASDQDFETLRILCGVPTMAAELGEGAIAAEAGIVQRSVSFTKGCYTGQELVARIDSRGNNVAKRLVGVIAADNTAVLAPNQRLVVDGTDVGFVTSASGHVGLAYLKRAVESLPAEVAIDDLPAQALDLPLL